ncbi:hypothetical protein P8452_59881 [Trifolium repens]|nr:hypothetical protein P8452_59881 [Trifolium repens]
MGKSFQYKKQLFHHAYFSSLQAVNLLDNEPILLFLVLPMMIVQRRFPLNIISACLSIVYSLHNSNYSGGSSIFSAPGGREKAAPFCPHVETSVRQVEASNSAIPCVAHGDCPNAISPEYYLCLNKIFIVFLSLIVLITSDNKLFCYNDDDCTSNLCRSPPYVRKCRLFLCYSNSGADPDSIPCVWHTDCPQMYYKGIAVPIRIGFFQCRDGICEFLRIT